MKSKQKSKISDLKDLIDKIKTLFIMTKNPSIKINELCEKIKAGSESISMVDSIGIFFYLKIFLDSIKKIIYKINELFPNWLRIKEHSIIGVIILLDMNVNVNDIISEIQTKNLGDIIFGY